MADLGKAVLQINAEDLNYLFRVLLDSVAIKDTNIDEKASDSGSG